MQPSPKQVTDAARAEIAAITPKIEVFTAIHDKLTAVTNNLHEKVKEDESRSVRINSPFQIAMGKTVLVVAEFNLAQAAFALNELIGRKSALERLIAQQEQLITIPGDRLSAN